MIHLKSDAKLSLDQPVGKAVFSNDMRYRYLLQRDWELADAAGIICWIGLNPSKADHEHNDQTITRMMNYSKLWGFAGMLVVNKYALISTSPKGLTAKHCSDPVGPKNDDYLLAACTKWDRIHTSMVLACWGSTPDPFKRGKKILKELSKQQIKVYCLGTTNKGCQPKHPLRLAANLHPIIYREIKA